MQQVLDEGRRLPQLPEKGDIMARSAAPKPLTNQCSTLSSSTSSIYQLKRRPGSLRSRLAATGAKRLPSRWTQERK